LAHCLPGPRAPVEDPSRSHLGRGGGADRDAESGRPTRDRLRQAGSRQGLRSGPRGPLIGRKGTVEVDTHANKRETHDTSISAPDGSTTADEVHDDPSYVLAYPVLPEPLVGAPTAAQNILEGHDTETKVTPGPEMLPARLHCPEAGAPLVPHPPTRTAIPSVVSTDLGHIRRRTRKNLPNSSVGALDALDPGTRVTSGFRKPGEDQGPCRPVLVWQPFATEGIPIGAHPCLDALQLRQRVSIRSATMLELEPD
jgi:hypothetical protein